MQTKLLASAFALALAAITGSDDAPEAAESPRPTVLHLTVPLPARVERGHASFSTSVGHTRWNLAALWSSGRGKPHFTLVLASEPDGAD